MSQVLPRPLKKAKKSSAAGQSAAAGSAIDDLTALTTAQLYSLSAKRNRDYSREIVRLATEERDRAQTALLEIQSRLDRGELLFFETYIFCFHTYLVCSFLIHDIFHLPSQSQ